MDVAKTNMVESELDSFVARRDQARRQDEGERPAEEIWAQSVRTYNAAREAEMRAAWCEHYRHMRALHGGLADEYTEKLRRLEMANGHAKESA